MSGQNKNLAYSDDYLERYLRVVRITVCDLIKALEERAQLPGLLFNSIKNTKKVGLILFRIKVRRILLRCVNVISISSTAYSATLCLRFVALVKKWSAGTA